MEIFTVKVRKTLELEWELEWELELELELSGLQTTEIF